MKKVSPPKKRNPAAGGKSNPRELILDAVVYPRGAVERAAQAFRALATIRVESTAEKHRIRFSGITAQVSPELQDEFANYVLYAAVNEP